MNTYSQTLYKVNKNKKWVKTKSGTTSSDPQCGDMPAAKSLAQQQNKTERSTRQ